MNAPFSGIGHLIFDDIDSTNAEAARRAAAGATQPLWILARRQTAGRGRRGRLWSTERGNFAATLLLPVQDWPGPRLAALGFLATLSAAETLDGLCPGAHVALKWPNDVLLDGGKVSGILIENFGRGTDGWTRVGIGIGLNLAHHPEAGSVRWPPTSVCAVTGHAPDPTDVLTDLSQRAAAWLDVLARTGPPRLIDAWRQRLGGIGSEIEVHLGDTRIPGIFAGVDQDGSLRLETSGGLRTITAADIFFRDGAHAPGD